MRSNGDFKWGALSITGSTAVFTGDIYANKIVGQIVNTQVADSAITDSKVSSGLNAGKVTLGTMSGNRLFGGTASEMNLSWAGITMYKSSTGNSFIDATSSVALRGGSQVLGVGSSSITLQGNIVNSGDVSFLNGSISVDGLYGYSTSRSISTSSGYKTFTWRKGLLISVA